LGSLVGFGISTVEHEGFIARGVFVITLLKPIAVIFGMKTAAKQIDTFLLKQISNFVVIL
jgi:hypothetical protein